MTFKQCAESYITAHRAGWKSIKHAGQWKATLTAYAYPTFGHLPVASVDVALVMKALEPIWTDKPETASRVRGRIESILDWATARGFRRGENPARWRALDVEDKAARVFNFHQNTLRALRDMLGAAGLEHPSQLGPEHILRRVSPTEVRSLAALYRFLAPGELLDQVPEHAVFRAFWASARADSFQPPERALEMRRSKLM